MTTQLPPSFILAALGAISGVLGTTLLGFGYGDAPHPGIYMVMTGVWFGLVIGFAVWRWGNRSWAAVATAALARRQLIWLCNLIGRGSTPRRISPC